MMRYILILSILLVSGCAFNQDMSNSEAAAITNAVKIEMSNKK